MKNIVHTIENESSKWFRRFMGVIIAIVVISLFIGGFTFIAGAIAEPTHFSLPAFIMGFVLIYYSSKSIDRVLGMFGYVKETRVVTKTRSIKKK